MIKDTNFKIGEMEEADTTLPTILTDCSSEDVRPGPKDTGPTFRKSSFFARVRPSLPLALRTGPTPSGGRGLLFGNCSLLFSSLAIFHDNLLL